MNIEPWMDLDVGDGPAPVVRAVQHLLNHRGASLTPDGVYGPLTQDAVRDLQRDHGMNVTGQVDAASWEVLAPVIRQGDTGDAVRALQAIDPGYAHHYLEVDGVFGPATASMVRFYQEVWGLGADEIVGDRTWSHLQTARPGVLQWPLAEEGAAPHVAYAVQHLLVHHGFSVTVDGVFGPLTGDAVRQWQITQRARYISRTVGFLDWPNLLVTLRRGDHGPAVRALQRLIGTLTVDGIFGEQTEREVEAYNLGNGSVATLRYWNFLLFPRLE